MNHPPPDDPRDAHLVAALRHAPDRDVVPPAQLSAAILGHAQQALRGRRAAPSGGWRAVWAQLWQPAPMAAFGTLAMATLIGVMWSAQEIPEATPSLRPEAVAVAPTQPLADAVPVASAAPAVVPAPAPAPAPRAAERATAERGAAVGKAAERDRPAAAQPRRSAKADPPSTVADRAVDAGAAAPEARQSAVAGEVAQASAMAPPPAAPPMPAPSPAPVVRRAAPLEPDSRRDALAKSTADTAPAAVRARNEMAAPAAALGAARPAIASPLAAADIAAAMAGDAARVRWRVSPERMLAHGAAQREWWSALARTAQGRWQFAASTPAGGAEVALLIDGALRGTLAFEPQALVWRDAGGVVWRATIEPAQGREWQEALARW